MIERIRQLEPLHARWSAPVHVFGWIVIAGTSALAVLYLTTSAPVLADAPADSASSTAAVIAAPPHRSMPKEVRGVYMSAATAGSAALRADVFAYLKRNRMNAVVIDAKDGNGRLAFKPERASLASASPDVATIKDLDALLSQAGEQGLYRIARVFVFQDPSYVSRFPAEAIHKKDGGIWADNKGVVWVNPASKADWYYNAEIAREAYARGFDEVQFDYIRFPSDGAMDAIGYPPAEAAKPKHEVIRDFFRFMHSQLEVKSRIPISYDLFGYTTWYVDYDLGIGQLLADALPNASAISPMVYPSHYARNTLGYPNPAEHPYEIISSSLQKANEQLYRPHNKECDDLMTGVKSATSAFLMPCNAPLAEQRPWIQAFDIGAVYTPDMIRTQIKAVRDQGGTGFLLWNARNVYRDFDAASTSTTQ